MIKKTTFRNFVESKLPSNSITVLRSPYRSIDLNLALEEALVRAFPFSKATRLLFLYRNDPVVVVGRHQNLWAECNAPLCREKSVAVQRRNSGGGTVYHDHGTLCMSFLTHKETYCPTTNMIWLAKTLQENSLIPPGESSYHVGEKRHDLFVEGKKISGSAMRLTGRTAYHHCTLLVDSDLTNVRSFLKKHPQLPFPFVASKATESVRSPVTSLQEISSSSSSSPSSSSSSSLSTNLVADLLGQNFLTRTNWCLNSTKNERMISDDQISLETEEQIGSSRGSYELEMEGDNEQEEEFRESFGAKKLFTLREIRSQLQSSKFIYGSSPNFTFEKKVSLSAMEFVIRAIVEKGGTITKAELVSSSNNAAAENLNEKEQVVEKFMREVVTTSLVDANLSSPSSSSSSSKRENEKLVVESVRVIFDRVLNEEESETVCSLLDIKNKEDESGIQNNFAKPLINQLLSWI